MIFDTDILIWYLRGNENASNAVVDSIPFKVSIVTYMELLQGMRNKHEMEKMKGAFSKMGIEIIPISESISRRAARLVEEYTLSHSMEMADALIAATCIEYGQTLFTANDKHYRMINEVSINVFRP